MNMKRNFVGIAIAFLLIAQTSIAGAQTFQTAKSRKGGWSEFAKNPGKIDDTKPKESEPKLTRQATGEADNSEGRDLTAKGGDTDAQAITETAKIVGTWLITVPDSPGVPGFKALQTFHENGTFTETSDLLGTLVEGPAHGAWTGAKNDYRLTFQVFAFDENGLPTVRVRVRCTIKVVRDTLTATTTVDIIEPDGNIILAVGGGPFSGVRQLVVPE